MIGFIAALAIYIMGCGLAMAWFDEEYSIQRFYIRRVIALVLIWPFVSLAIFGHVVWKFGLVRLIHWAFPDREEDE